jgi:hypothetical protein
MNPKGVPTPTHEEVDDLIRSHDGLLVSLLMPPTPPDEARIALRNLAKDAGARLASAGMRSADVRARLAPVDVVLESHDAWLRPEASMAIYLADDGSTLMPGPESGAPLVVVGRGFQVKHLLDAVPSPRFAVLALSRKATHLFVGDASRCEEVESAGLPMEMDEVLRLDDREPQLQSHGSARRGGGAGMGSFHGQGGGHEQGEDLRRYLRAVGGAVDSVLSDECLVLAGTEELVAAFRRATSYAHVAPGDISGSGERLSAAELAAAARPLAATWVTAHREDVRSRLIEMTGTDGATVDLTATVTAAVDGRVDALFVAGDAEVWGHFDPAQRRLVDPVTEDEAEDLLNLAAVETWRHGGEVYVIPEADVPGAEPLAALLRY